MNGMSKTISIHLYLLNGVFASKYANGADNIVVASTTSTPKLREFLILFKVFVFKKLLKSPKPPASRASLKITKIGKTMKKKKTPLIIP